MARRRLREYPRVVYGPHGASMVITRLEDWPKGWGTSPERDDNPPSLPAEKPAMARSEMKGILRERGVAFNETAADIELWRLVSA